MSETCSDCKYHICYNTCVHTRKSCDGYCKIKKRHKNCYGTKCKKFKLDEYFLKK